MEEVPVEELERATSGRFVDLFVRVRIVVAPAVALLAALAALEGPLWRSATLLSATVGVVVISLLEHRRYQRDGELALGVAANLLALMVSQAVVITGTGGLLSPLLPGVIVFGVVVGLFGPATFSRWVPFVLHLPWLGLLAWLHVSGVLEDFIPFYLEGWAALGRGPGPWVIAGVYALFAVLAPQTGRKLRDVITDAYGDLGTARQRELELHRSQREQLETLTGELARDLEDPLSTMVGLGSRLERELGEGGERKKAAEHVRVLRTEVDRMRSVVAELVDFARPVSPRQRQQHDLEALVREIVALYEGACAERALTIECVSRGETTAPVDKRKIRTVLMHLIQTAVEGCPAGSKLRIDLSTHRDEVRIAFRDGGLRPSAPESPPAERPESHRAGLAMTIARTLVHQHDGRIEGVSDDALDLTVHLPRHPH